MFGTLPTTYAQWKDFWTNHFKDVQKFYKDWAEDVTKKND
jgi:hypothetical protein